MNEVLAKISSYNIFNYLFPGAVFSSLCEKLGVFSPPTEMVEQLLWFYFAGLAISRVGSILIEPTLKKIRLIEFSNYTDYLSAQERDAKLEVMVEVANTYRTLTSCFAVLFVVASINHIAFENTRPTMAALAALFALFVLFLASYKKQTHFITLRVKNVKENA